MRVVEVEVSCPVNARVLWAMRSDFELEKRLAAKNGRTLVLGWEKAGEDGNANPTVSRRTSCIVDRGLIPLPLRPLVSSGDLISEVESRWFVNRWDEEHPCITGVVVGGGKVTLRTTTWVKRDPKVDEGEAEADACVVCTRTVIECVLAGIGGFVERLFQADLRAAHLAYLELLLQERDAEETADATTEAEAGGRNGGEEVRAGLLADKLGELPFVQQRPKKTAKAAKAAKAAWRFLAWSPRDRGRRREEGVEISQMKTTTRGLWRGCCGGAGAVREVRVDAEQVVG